MVNASLNAMHQDRHQADAYRRIELITGTVRRRRWSNDEKSTIVAESTRPGVNVAEVARRFGVNRGLLQTWRRKAIGERPVFVPLRVEGMVAADNNKDRTSTSRSAAVETDASTRPGTVEIESGGVRVRFNAISEGLSAEPPRHAPIFRKTDDGLAVPQLWCMGFLAGMRLRMDAWRPLLDLNRIDHGLMLPILLCCVDASGRPMLGPPREGPETEEFLRTAYQDIPIVVPAIREFWMPERMREANGQR